MTIVSPPLIAAGLATLLPFVAFASLLVFFRRHPRWSAALSLAAAASSLACALFLLSRQLGAEGPFEYGVRWLVSGDLSLRFGLLLDPLSVWMLTVVTAVSFLVQVYSLGYMAADPGFGRYYAYLSLFAWAMMNLTLSPNLLQLYFFWELVGLSSYLLIGFWYERFSATQAGKKAFVMTRTGDVGFFLGILVLLLTAGDVRVSELNGPALAGLLSPTFITLSALLLFCGIIGKSAQFPLMTWLPDAMEGPTPVSALLHSATMVAAGVYLLARLFPFFRLSPTAMAVFLGVGTISLVLASTMAMVSRDIKKIWAYSTISQLGMMIMGLSAGGYLAGVFHLSTHAAFKALLFLCSGVLLHRFGTNDIFELGRRGGRSLLLPASCLAIGAAALAGLPPFSGFFSKDAILGVLAALPNPLWFVAGLVGAFLTAYYAFRAVFILWSPEREPAHAGPTAEEHASEPARYAAMGAPLVVLAAATVLLGFVEAPLRELLVGRSAAAVEHGHAPWLPLVASVASLAGVGLAWLEFGRRRAPRIGFVERVPALASFFAERWYLDRFYEKFVQRVIDGGLSYLSAQNERWIIDGAIDGLSRAVVSAGTTLAVWGRAMIQYRMLVTFGTMVLLALFYLLVR